MAKRYRIRDGYSFMLDSGEIANAGAEIELDDDIAALHAMRIEPIEPVEPIEPPQVRPSADDGKE